MQITFLEKSASIGFLATSIFTLIFEKQSSTFSEKIALTTGIGIFGGLFGLAVSVLLS